MNRMRGFYRLLVPLSLLLIAPGQSDGQTRDRVVGQRLESFVGLPEPKSLVITGIRLAGKAVRINRPFPAADGWLRELVIRVKNISGRPISSARVLVSPERGRFEFTLPPVTAAGGGQGAVASGALLPGDEADLKLSEYSQGGERVTLSARHEEAIREVVTNARWAIIEYAVIRYEGESKERTVNHLRVSRPR